MIITSQTLRRALGENNANGDALVVLGSGTLHDHYDPKSVNDAQVSPVYDDLSKAGPINC